MSIQQAGALAPQVRGVDAAVLGGHAREFNDLVGLGIAVRRVDESGREAQGDVPRAAQSFDLAAEDRGEGHVVPDRGQRGRVRHQLSRGRGGTEWWAQARTESRTLVDQTFEDPGLQSLVGL